MRKGSLVRLKPGWIAQGTRLLTDDERREYEKEFERFEEYLAPKTVSLEVRHGVLYPVISGNAVAPHRPWTRMLLLFDPETGKNWYVRKSRMEEA